MTMVSSVSLLLVIRIIALRSKQDSKNQIDHDLLEAFLNHIPDNVFFKDRDSRFVRISRAMADYIGLPDPKLAEGKLDSDIFSPEHAGQALADEREIIRTGQPQIGVEEKETWPDGRESWVLTNKLPLTDHCGQIIGTMGIARNITDWKLAEQRLQHMALHDALTGLPNRVLLQDRLLQAIALARRSKNSVAVLMVDLDRFKNVNDFFGHNVGDRLLVGVAARLRATLRESDILARLGGDEFVIVVPLVLADGDVETVANKVIAALCEPFQLEGHTLQIGTSVGISLFPADGADATTLLQFSDAAMYEAKKKGGGTYCFFTSELANALRRRQTLEKNLHGACSRGEFAVHYQPLISTSSGQVTGVEALLRWNHPEEGLISPIEFIPRLEDLGLMVDVGDWVLKTACLQIMSWRKKGITIPRVAVNVSAQQFYRGDLARSVEQILCETGLRPDCLELELTESLTLDDSAITIEIMQSLKGIGVSLSLDDFGTGWSSLSYLRQFPIDRLKIDKSFLRDISSDPAAARIARSILDLGNNLGLSCIGEGVETWVQREYLYEQGCEEMQGFLFSRALPPDDCGELLRSWEPWKTEDPEIPETSLPIEEVSLTRVVGPAICS
ncbi:diguanylate cyclase (GGDEF)-like protein/PAS domain S-box-containing protein [Granulicella aggregans]|uniref:Diguanylate cyclase (GGDEF)-like protein/PAS domain S-box-containing protein n=1 Tax=Granulicella aggregans TaxID=474949 RepID=A0A7W7ZID3_9BACT|nr:GGDEF and EAL domain-containing protein [Granulicella aggregans]MBB5060396.1 diguanylate cyclase (GGDEF)-like protein/PAS domain S-box-containing protein [Granulicella aggregans]